MSSKITLEIVGVDGSIRGVFKTTNVMTSFGLENWARSSLGAQLAIGSGSRAELETVTSLAGFVRSATGTYSYSNVSQIDETSGVMRSDHTLNVTFPPETESQNYSEVGIHGGNPEQLQTYALIRDLEGAPTSISILAGEQIRVSYIVQFSTPIESSTLRTIGGVSTTVTVVPLSTGQTNEMRLPNAAAAATRFWPSGQDVPNPGSLPVGGTQGPSNATITNGVYSLAIEMNELNLAGGISLMRLGGTSNSPGIMVHFDPPVGKTAALSMNIAVNSILSNGVYHA